MKNTAEMQCFFGVERRADEKNIKDFDSIYNAI